MILALFATSSLAMDAPSWWLRQSVGGGLFPEGALLDTRGQYRVPLHRSASRVFKDTYAGAGLRVAFSPINAEVGPRLSISPIDVFDLEVQASYLGYYSWGGRGLLPFDAPSGKALTASGKSMPRVVRVTADANGRVLKISTSH